jgi:hypothetical protein
MHVILAARIDRLPADDKQLLQTAAVVGRHVPLVLLHAVEEAGEDALAWGCRPRIGFRFRVIAWAGTSGRQSISIGSRDGRLVGR